VAPFAPEGPHPDDLMANMSLPERADEVERRLGLALKSYRERAEGILESHFDALERAQLTHDHDLSMLKAENAKLREMVGKPGDPSLLQSVLFQSMTPVVDPKSKKKDAKNKMKQGGEDEDSVAPKGGRKNKKNETGPEKPGGSWQQFVAWCPNGAALMNPEPWKPLPDAQAMKSQKSILGNHTAGIDFWGVMPGALGDEAHTSSKKKREDRDDDDSDVDEEDDNKLELVEVWKFSDKDRRSVQNGKGGSEQLSRWDSETEGEDYEGDHKVRPRFILNPDSGIRIAWDLSSLCMVVYDMIMIPMAVFTMPDHVFLLSMDWVTRLFWTFDMGWSCCTGVVLADGSVEYNFRSIFKRYLKSWFPLDFFIVGSDWSGVLLSSGGMGLSKLARVSRVARVVRLLRLVRMQEVIANITERIQSDSTIMLLQVLKLLVFLIACCHFTGCGWWAVGNSSKNLTWIKKYGYADEDVGLQYLVSLHWSLSQFAGGIDELPPVSGVERFYTLLVFVISFISFLVMGSFLTSRLTQQYIIGGTGARQMSTLKKYLTQNKVSKNLIKRLCRSAKHAISGDLQPESVDLLHVVSEPLKMEMHYEMFSRILSNHPFFSDFMREANPVMRRICHSCISMLLLDSGDVLFRTGDEPATAKMYFLSSGALEYVDQYGEPHNVNEKEWLAEAALWTYWKHQGTLTALTDAKILVIEAELFQDVCAQYMKKHKDPKDFNPKEYAKAFVDQLNTQTQWSDLHVDS